MSMNPRRNNTQTTEHSPLLISGSPGSNRNRSFCRQYFGSLVITFFCFCLLGLFIYLHHFYIPTLHRSTVSSSEPDYPDITNPDKIPVTIIETRKNGEIYYQFLSSPSYFIRNLHRNNNNKNSTIVFNYTQTYQTIYGFGGAITEASAIHFSKLSSENQERFLDLYYNQSHGSAYQFGRIPINSCDFSPASYNFDNVTDDRKLEHFDMKVSHDSQTMIPLIKRIIQKYPNVKLFGSPWSPPDWMKYPHPYENSTRSMLGSAKPNGLDKQYMSTWALYLKKFFQAYETEYNITFWGMTVQNEPEYAADWEACMYTPEYMSEFVTKHLGPTIREFNPNLKIMIYDHNRGGIYDFVSKYYKAYPSSKQYVDGIAFHWYDDERQMDGINYYENLKLTYDLDRSKFLFGTEQCNCPNTSIHDSDLSWFRAQRYVHDIINDMNNYVSGWNDWNLILNENGGPNHLGNLCDAPLILQNDTFTIQPMYYAIRHFSQFVTPGSKRVDVQVNVKFSKTDKDAQLLPQYRPVLAACDMSSRQEFTIIGDAKGDLKVMIPNSGYCIDVAYGWFGEQVRLIPCIYSTHAWKVETPNPKYQSTKIIKYDNHTCLDLNMGHLTDGTTISLNECKKDKATQKFIFEDGKMYSYASKTCVTGGYPFVEATGFITNEEKYILVTSNENTIPIEFNVNFGDYVLETEIPAQSIRTYMWEL